MIFGSMMRCQHVLVLLCIVSGVSLFVLGAWPSDKILKSALSGSQLQVDGQRLFSSGGERLDSSGTHLETDQASVSGEHPIQALARQAQESFDSKLSRQSRSFREASAEYLRRYRRSPPPGFKKWYDYAVAESSMMIDDFDTLEEAIVPFLRRSGSEIQEFMRDIKPGYDDQSVIWSCRLRDGRMEAGCEHLGESILRLFADSRILPSLPELTLIVNAFDEPRVLLQNKVAARVRRQNTALQWSDLAQKDVWDQVVTEQCHTRHRGLAARVPGSIEQPVFGMPISHDTGKLRESRGVPSETYGLPFIQDISDTMNLCAHADYRGLHGFLTSPASFKMTHAPIPILSNAVPSTMGDIPFPATAYNSDSFQYDESTDYVWTDKTSGLYWAGKSTGGHQKDNNKQEWKNLHRQRFVALANDLEPHSHRYLQRLGEHWEVVEGDFLNTSSYHAHLTDIVHCDANLCKEIAQYYDVREPEPGNAPFKYTLNFDIDGNGHSGRYYRLLASNSLPLKQTIFREWHDDRLQPWLHYIPISLGMEELAEVVRYLTEDEQGNELAQQLAMRGREWTRKALRPVDQVIYLYRLMLELGRIQDPNRRPLS